MSKGSIKDPSVRIKPSESMCEFIASLSDQVEMPSNVLKVYRIYSGDSSTKQEFCDDIPKDTFTKEEINVLSELAAYNEQQDEHLTKIIDLDENDNVDEEVEDDTKDVKTLSKTQAKRAKEKQKQKERSSLVLNLNDLKWINLLLLEKRRADSSFTQYLHELMEGAQVVLPKNELVERNPELEKRCVRLRLEQDARRYRAMTRNVDSSRKHIPEDTISYQMKQINRHLIAVLQFVFSVAAGFAFGFIGVELIIGNLDFGFRLLLGIICALTIALAEIYFLAKKLNEEYDVSIMEPELLASGSTKDKPKKAHAD